MAFWHRQDPALEHTLGQDGGGKRRGRGLSIATASLIACTLPLMGMSAANAAPIDGAPSIGDSLFAGIGNTGYEVKHYDVDINYTFDAKADRAARSVVAQNTITANAPVELGKFSLDFEGMNVDAITVNGAPATWERTTNKPTEAYKLIILPAAPVVGDFTVVVNYSGVPTKHIDNDGSPEGWVPTSDGAIVLGQPVGAMAWLPSNNTPADKATFDISLTVPTTIGGKPAGAVSNGEMVGKTVSTDGLETTWNWSQQNQMATMSAMLGIGNYDITEGTITLLSGKVIPEWTFVDSALSAPNKATTELRRLEIQEITQFLESKYGPYPGNSTGFVVDISNVGYALETQDRSYFPSTPGKSTLVHEMAHQWFGTAVTPADWNSIWISEGQASYASNLYNEGHGGTATKSTYHTMWNGTAAGHARWTIATAAMTDQTDLFGWQVYNRGGMAFEALRQVVGDDTFFAILQAWTQNNNGKSMVTEDFIALANATSGKDLTAFFQDWVYDADKPAWPSLWTLGLGSDPADGVVAPGDEITYTLTATNAGQVDLAGTAQVDLAGVLDDATLDAAALDPSLTLTGTTLTWAVPATTGTNTATVDFSVQVGDRAYGAALDATATGSLGATCTTCATAHTTAAVPVITGDDLTDSNRGGLVAPAKAVPGDMVTIDLASAAHDGETVSGVLFSDPIALGSSPVASAAAKFKIPANAPLGKHRIAVLDSIGLLIGWADIELVAAPVDTKPPATGTGNGSGLSSTGSDDTGLWVAGGAAALLLLGGGALLLARRRATAE